MSQLNWAISVVVCPSARRSRLRKRRWLLTRPDWRPSDEWRQYTWGCSKCWIDTCPDLWQKGPKRTSCRTETKLAVPQLLTISIFEWSMISIKEILENSSALRVKRSKVLVKLMWLGLLNQIADDSDFKRSKFNCRIWSISDSNNKIVSSIAISI